MATARATQHFITFQPSLADLFLAKIIVDGKKRKIALEIQFFSM
jgi:hypothetical protein